MNKYIYEIVKKGISVFLIGLALGVFLPLAASAVSALSTTTTSSSGLYKNQSEVVNSYTLAQTPVALGYTKIWTSNGLNAGIGYLGAKTELYKYTSPNNYTLKASQPLTYNASAKKSYEVGACYDAQSGENYSAKGYTEGWLSSSSKYEGFNSTRTTNITIP